MPAVYIAPHPLAPTREDKAVRERAAKRGLSSATLSAIGLGGCFTLGMDSALWFPRLSGARNYFPQNGRPDGWRAETGPEEKAAQSRGPFRNLE